MEYFGISNKDPANNPFIKDFNLFPFIKKENLLNSINIKESETVHDNTDYHHCSVPILYEYRNKESLKKIWDGIKDGDIVTNRGAKRSLAAGKSNLKIEKKLVKISDREKTIYLISRGEKKKLTSAKFNSGYQAEANVFERPLKDYTIYRYIKRFNEDLKCFEHYTCEIDGFIKKENRNFLPVEFKCFTSPNIDDLFFERMWKINTVIQCKLAGIENLIIGARNSERMKLYYYNVGDFESDVKNSVRLSLLSMNKNMKELVKTEKVPEY
uniref:YqaJ viral recombinase domain-containing protein n=1 Tax=Panagrolaimus sp. ES5 TaxID=591445 RepID=A0AC34GY49_9BILA